MEINNPQSFDHIIGINGEILQPKVVALGDLEHTKIVEDPIIWRKTTADEFHAPAAVLSDVGVALQVKNVAYGDLDPAKIGPYSIFIYQPDLDLYYLPSALLLESGSIMRCKVIEIGPWDMDTDIFVDVAHGLAQDQIRSISVVIIDDDSVQYQPLTKGVDAVTNTQQGFVSRWTATHIHIMRLTGGDFDSIYYEDGIMNRGYVTIWYTD